MPDFWPMIRGVLPTILCAVVFVGVIKFIAFVNKRWKSN